MFCFLLDATGGRLVRQRLAQYSTAMESIHATAEPQQQDAGGEGM